MQKKGVDMSMNVIIVAAIALLILVILTVLILRSGANVKEGTGCLGVSGHCAQECDQGTIPHLTQGGTKGGCAEDEKCCVPL